MVNVALRPTTVGRLNEELLRRDLRRVNSYSNTILLFLFGEWFLVFVVVVFLRFMLY
jgi:hypothetical protein